MSPKRTKKQEKPGFLDQGERNAYTPLARCFRSPRPQEKELQEKEAELAKLKKKEALVKELKKKEAELAKVGRWQL